MLNSAVYHRYGRVGSNTSRGDAAAAPDDEPAPGAHEPQQRRITHNKFLKDISGNNTGQAPPKPHPRRGDTPSSIEMTPFRYLGHAYGGTDDASHTTAFESHMTRALPTMAAASLPGIHRWPSRRPTEDHFDPDRSITPTRSRKHEPGQSSRRRQRIAYDTAWPRSCTCGGGCRLCIPQGETGGEWAGAGPHLSTAICTISKYMYYVLRYSI